MLNIISKGVAKIFGTKADRDLKELTPYVGKINAEFDRLSDISDDELRGKTEQLKATIAEKLTSIDDQIAELHKQVADNPKMDIHQKEDVFNNIDKLEEERDEELEKILEDILPQAFAVVKETARRLASNGKLVVTANMNDKLHADSKEHVEIEGDKAIWHNEWMAAGNKITWNMVHYDVQLI